MKLHFTKMHGAGNDFIVIDAVRQSVDVAALPWRALADRRFGIGADQILIVEPARTPGVDFRYRIFNADGSEVQQCGNGSRAFVRFVVEKGLTDKRSITVETLGGIIVPRMEEDGSITVDMGAPRVQPQQLPFDSQGLLPLTQGEENLWPLDLGEYSVPVGLVSMGNPHAVQIVSDIDTHPVSSEGPLIERHPRFPERVNAGFMQILSPSHVRLRVYERGAGETLACGTGACAAVVSGVRRGLLQTPVTVDMAGGTLRIDWPERQSVLLAGPAVSVFDGEISL